MKQIKKVAVSKIQPADGAVVDSFSASVDKTTNAPSIRAVEELLENYTPSGGASVLETNPIGAILEWPSDTIPTNWLLCNGQAVSRTEYSELFKVIGTTYGAGDGSTTFNVPDRRGNTAIGKDDSDTDFNTLGKTGGAKKRTLVLANIPSHTHTFTGTAHTHTLNGHTHSVGAHSHGLNSHTHSIPALSGTAKSAGSHSHSVRSLANAANTGGNNYLREWSKSGDTATDGVGSAGAHTHSVTTTASTTGKASGSTANSTAFNTGANSGNTSSTTAKGTIGEAGSGTEFDIMNPHIVQNFIIKAKETAAVIAKVEDSLTSDSTTDALSAAQGKKLKELIDNLPNSEIQGTGAPEIAIGPDEPTGEEVLWIDDEYDVDPDDIDIEQIVDDKLEPIEKEVSGISFDINSLLELLVKKSQDHIGEYTLWEGNICEQENGSYYHIGTHYSAINGVLSRFPVKGTPFTRKYKIVVDYSTTNITNGDFHVKLSKSGTKLSEYLFHNIWGSTSDGVRTYSALDFNINHLGDGHLDIEVSPTFGTGAYFRIYRIYLLIYDTLDNYSLS